MQTIVLLNAETLRLMAAVRKCRAEYAPPGGRWTGIPGRQACRFDTLAHVAAGRHGWSGVLRDDLDTVVRVRILGLPTRSISGPARGPDTPAARSANLVRH